MPLINSAFKPLSGATIFTELVYHLAQIRAGDEWKTVQYPLGRVPGHAKWTNQRPTVVQALVNNILQDFLNRFVFVYLDDILLQCFFGSLPTSTADSSGTTASKQPPSLDSLPPRPVLMDTRGSTDISTPQVLVLIAPC